MYIDKIKYVTCVIARTAFLFGLIWMLTACSGKDSGLYRINASEETREIPVEEDFAAAEVSDTAETVKEEPAPADIADAAEEITGKVYVHVCGAVKAPGVYEMEPGDRIFNAVEAAGGFTDDAAQDYINLAMPVEDGMKIAVPTTEELESSSCAENPEDAVMYGVKSSGVAETGTGSGGSVGRININLADESGLTGITGIGPTRAAAIVAYRNEHGAFSSIEEIKNVSGIGDATFEKIKDQISIGD